MGLLGELLATDHRQALEFYVLRFQDVRTHDPPSIDRSRPTTP